MSAFLGSKIVAKATPVVAKRDVTVRAASASDGVNRRAAVAGVIALFASAAASPANAETKRVAKKEKDTRPRYLRQSGGGGQGVNKPPRATLKSKQDEIMKAYGIPLPGQ